MKINLNSKIKEAPIKVVPKKWKDRRLVVKLKKKWRRKKSLKDLVESSSNWREVDNMPKKHKKSHKKKR